MQELYKKNTAGKLVPDVYPFIIIYDFMLDDLKLDGKELLVFALIFSFCTADARGRCYSSLSYFQQRLHASRPTVCKCLKSLLKKGYIIKRPYFINGVPYNFYRIGKAHQQKYKVKAVKVVNSSDSEETELSSKDTSQKQLNNFTKSSKETEPSNKCSNKRVIKSVRGEAPSHSQKKDNYLKLGKHGNVLLTKDEYLELLEKYKEQGKAKIDRLSVYMFTTNKSYVNHFALLCQWCEEDKEADSAKPKGKKQLSRKASFDIDKIAARAKLNDNYDVD